METSKLMKKKFKYGGDLFAGSVLNFNTLLPFGLIASMYYYVNKKFMKKSKDGKNVQVGGSAEEMMLFQQLREYLTINGIPLLSEMTLIPLAFIFGTVAFGKYLKKLKKKQSGGGFDAKGMQYGGALSIAGVDILSECTLIPIALLTILYKLFNRKKDKKQSGGGKSSKSSDSLKTRISRYMAENNLSKLDDNTLFPFKLAM
jgi:hypothetical protein